MFEVSSKLTLSSDRVNIAIRPYGCTRPIDFRTT